jgi:hypothetical protein
MKAKLKENWIPKWQQNWNKYNRHKVDGKFVVKEHPTVIEGTNHERMLQRKAERLLNSDGVTSEPQASQKASQKEPLEKEQDE